MGIADDEFRDADDESRYTVAVFTKMNQWWAVCNLQSGRGVFGLW